MTKYDIGPAFPNSITTGPDGALWFTNLGGGGVDGDGNNFFIPSSVGRITTAGVLSGYTSPYISDTRTTGADFAGIITAGPDGAVWFTNNNNSIGRIATGFGTPLITSVSPTSGPVGTTVKIRGTALEEATSVTFNHVTATIVSDSATKIVVTVPPGATTGYIKATTASGSVKSATVFTVT